jgi:hypothetical protein
MHSIDRLAPSVQPCMRCNSCSLRRQLRVFPGFCLIRDILRDAVSLSVREMHDHNGVRPRRVVVHRRRRKFLARLPAPQEFDKTRPRGDSDLISTISPRQVHSVHALAPFLTDWQLQFFWGIIILRF